MVSKIADYLAASSRLSLEMSFIPDEAIIALASFTFVPYKLKNVVSWMVIRLGGNAVTNNKPI